MAAPKGNEFWKARTKHGRDKLFKDSQVLWDACVEYFEWVEANPLWEARIAQRNGEPEEFILPKMRAMTIGGLCVFLDISQETWCDYRKKKDYSEIIEKVDQIIREQKFTGASAGLLNPNIIARDLGLSDKQETTHKGLTISITAKDDKL